MCSRFAQLAICIFYIEYNSGVYKGGVLERGMIPARIIYKLYCNQVNKYIKIINVIFHQNYKTIF